MDFPSLFSIFLLFVCLFSIFLPASLSVNLVHTLVTIMICIQNLWWKCVSMGWRSKDSLLVSYHSEYYSQISIYSFHFCFSHPLFSLLSLCFGSRSSSAFTVFIPYQNFCIFWDPPQALHMFSRFPLEFCPYFCTDTYFNQYCVVVICIFILLLYRIGSITWTETRSYPSLYQLYILVPSGYSINIYWI